jgi:hypothetical protein
MSEHTNMFYHMFTLIIPSLPEAVWAIPGCLEYDLQKLYICPVTKVKAQISAIWL